MDSSFQNDPPSVIVRRSRGRWLVWLLFFLLVGSCLLNLMLSALCASFLTNQDKPIEKFHSGDKLASAKIARLVTDFTIMPPHTKRLLETIKHVTESDEFKGAVLVIDSPGGLVSDSHEIYHQLRKLAKKKPVFVSMKGIAASGGYYIAMGAGPGAPIYAQPTTWTGSIGVIMPRYDASELARKIGVEPDSLVTGPLKETLNPLKPMSPEEKKVWDVILDDSFQRFLHVIDDSREKLNFAQVQALATGQVYTADQALENGLIDQIGYEEDVLEALKTRLNLKQVRVVNFSYPKSLAETLVGASSHLQGTHPLSRLLEASVPRAMYFCGWPGSLPARAE